jgi:TRAP-type mannitol/chloroaromatic compound transport system permease small subunit
MSMPRWLVVYVQAVERFCYGIGRVAMYALFALMAVLLWGALARAGGTPQIWTDEMAQFILLGYFMLGGAYALQMGSAVRMDVFYARWSDRTKAAVDCVTILALVFYLVVLLWGGIESTAYSIDVGERRRGLWRPYMWPVKAIMVAGIVLMILQVSAILIRDIARVTGREMPPPRGRGVVGTQAGGATQGGGG